MMTLYGSLHPRSDVDRPYVSRTKGGRGLTSIHVQDTVQIEEQSLSQYRQRNISEEEFLTATAIVISKWNDETSE